MRRLATLIIALGFLGSSAFAQRSIKEEYKLKFDDVLNLMETKYVESPEFDKRST